MNGFETAKQWLESRIAGIQDEIEEISTFIEDNKNDLKLIEKVQRYKVMLACRLHTKSEFEVMFNDLRANLENEETLENIE